jgi:hypothetical protein
VNNLNIACPVRVNATVGFTCQVWAITNEESVGLELASSPPISGQRSTIQTWSNVIDQNFTTNLITITSALSNYTFTVSMLDTATNGSSISIQRLCFVQVLPVFASSIATANNLNSTTAWMSTVLILNVITSGFAVSLNVNFGDGTSTVLSNLTDTSVTIEKVYNNSGSFIVNVTAVEVAFVSRMRPAILNLNVIGKIFKLLLGRFLQKKKFQLI